MGGMIGLLYLFCTFLIEWYMADFDIENHREGFGLLMGILNLPGTLLSQSSIIPYALRINSVFQFSMIAVTNFVIGALLGSFVQRIWKGKTST